MYQKFLQVYWSNYLRTVGSKRPLHTDHYLSCSTLAFRRLSSKGVILQKRLQSILSKVVKPVMTVSKNFLRIFLYHILLLTPTYSSNMEQKIGLRWQDMRKIQWSKSNTTTDISSSCQTTWELSTRELNFFASLENLIYHSKMVYVSLKANGGSMVTSEKLLLCLD